MTGFICIFMEAIGAVRVDLCAKDEGISKKIATFAAQ